MVALEFKNVWKRSKYEEKVKKYTSDWFSVNATNVLHQVLHQYAM